MLRYRAAVSGFSAKDISAEKAFFADTLGVDVSEEDGMLTLNLAGGHRVLVYPKENHQPATYTCLNLFVDDIDVAVDGLVAAGITFERYGPDFPQDERGIMRAEGMGPPIAWFTDPAGNIIALIEEADGGR